MQISVTNLSGVTVPLNTGAGSGYGLQPGATNVSVTLPDSELGNISGLRASGAISYTFTISPNIPADLGAGKLGRTTPAGATYTAQASDFGAVIDCPIATALTLPANAPRGVSLSVLQSGSGAVTFAVQSGGALRLPGTATKTNGQWTLASAFVRDNVGGKAAEWVVAGNVA